MRPQQILPAPADRVMPTDRRRCPRVRVLLLGIVVATGPALAREVPFVEQTPITTAADIVVDLVTADLDGDGDIDSVSASWDDNTILWYENDGAAGGWTPHDISTTVREIWSLSAADIDRDGDIDVLSTSFRDDEVAWHENDGAGGTWTFHSITTAADGAFDVIASDMDGDGDLDVISGSQNDDTVAWYENDGSGGGWAPHSVTTTAAEIYEVDAGDVDGDGDLDVLAAIFDDDKVAWFENDGAGGGWTEHLISADVVAATSVDVADVDGDGDLDVLLGASQNEVRWMTNEGAGVWNPNPKIGDADSIRSVVAADLDGDGDLDALSASRDDDTIAWFANEGAGTAWTRTDISTSALGAYDAVAADVDNDGDLDVLSASLGDDTIAWYANDGTGSVWARTDIFTSADSTLSVVAADLDGDGDLDALSASGADDPIVWHENISGQAAVATSVEAPPVLQDGGVAVLMALEVTHLGKPGETDAELATVELLFEEQPGTPLTYVEVNDLIETLSVFRDDGDGVFDSNADEHVTSVEFLSLIDGRLTVLLVDGATSCGVVWGAPGLFFIVVQATPDASAQSPNSMVVTHLIDERTGGPVSTIEDRNHDIALQLLDAANVTSSPVSFVEPGLIFADGFESGGTSAWSSTLP